MALPINTSPVRSQRDVRTARIFTDEFGRRWAATVNNLGVHAGYPCTPLTPMFEAPIYPPPQYLVIDDVAIGLIHTNTDKWLADREQKLGEYELLKQQQAVVLYGDGAAAAIDRNDRALLFRIGQPPLPVEQVLAYKQGHPWVIGKDPNKPKSLTQFFPDTPAVALRRFLTAQEEADQAAVQQYKKGEEPQEEPVEWEDDEPPDNGAELTDEELAEFEEEEETGNPSTARRLVKPVRRGVRRIVRK